MLSSACPDVCIEVLVKGVVARLKITQITRAPYPEDTRDHHGTELALFFSPFSSSVLEPNLGKDQRKHN